MHQRCYAFLQCVLRGVIAYTDTVVSVLVVQLEYVSGVCLLTCEESIVVVFMHCQCSVLLTQDVVSHTAAIRLSKLYCCSNVVSTLQQLIRVPAGKRRLVRL